MIAGLDHVNIETLDLASSVKFYKDLLGLTVGWRPAFDVPGAWLYVGDQPIVHLVVRDKVNPAPTGAINHIALKAEGLAEALNTLNQWGLEYSQTFVPDVNVTQVFVKDPNDVTLELNFYAEGKA